MSVFPSCSAAMPSVCISLKVVKGGHTCGMTEIDNKPRDDHRKRREVQPIGLVMLARLRLAANSKLKSETYEEENACDASQIKSDWIGNW